MKLVTAEVMRELDRTTIQDVGIPGVVLMENAGAGCARLILDEFEEEVQGGVAVVCGAGNNGGDGFVIARHLWNAGVDATVILLDSPQALKDDAKINFEIAEKIGLSISTVEDFGDGDDFLFELDGFGLIVDAIFGTGLARDVTGRFAEAVEAINEADAPVFAVDMPSGIHSDSGKVMGAAVFADTTATFALPKIGQWLFPGHSYCGRLEIVDISIPFAVIEDANISCERIETSTIFHMFTPRAPEAHKGNFGHVLVVGGAQGLTGAPVLAAKAAALAGAGLVTAAVPASLNPIIEAKLTEQMSVPLADNGDGTFSDQAVKALLHAASDKTVCVIGPGIGRSPGTKSLLFQALPEIKTPMVIDADALNLLAEDLSVLERLQNEAVLTPHPGEMARLTGLSVEEILDDRIGVAVKFANEHGVTVVLKSERTVIATPEGDVFLNTTGNPGMATGGTGDVLTGLIAGLIAQGWLPIEAAIAGVYIHGLAGDVGAQIVGHKSLLAGDLLDQIPNVIAGIERFFQPEPDETESD